ncbi:MAG TPA: tetratricopeptide repeat protein [Micromonosporaceae bacterium]
MAVDDACDIAAQAAAAQTVADLARVLRELRRRHARRRRRPVLTYRQIADRTGWSVSTVGGYFTGTKLASVDRFDELCRRLGADPREQGVLATAREQVAEARRGTEAGDSTAGPLGGTRLVVPRTLPPAVFGFTGRVAQLARLDGLLASATMPHDAVVSTVVGMAGVGKTALALQWAHAVADEFPDGQLYLNLRGCDPGEPLTAMDALAVLVSALGVAPAATPTDLAGRTGLYRRLLDGRRVLVLLDNASGTEQVRPLLPPPPCLALITSRGEVDLAAGTSMQRIALDVLTQAEALSLLRLLIGQRVDREDETARALARRCGFLPLALRVAAEHVASRPDTSLAELMAEFGDEEPSGRLDLFGMTGDSRTDVRSVFSWSLRRMPGPAARGFRLLGLTPGNDLDAYGVAALAAVDLDEAQRLAGTLAGAHLTQSDGCGRISMHDLMRAYAVESGEQELGIDERHVALTRLLDYYLAAATAMVDVVFPLSRSGRPSGVGPSPAGSPTTPAVSDAAAASSWLAAERDNLVRACVHAARNGWLLHAVRLALVLRPYFDDGHYRDGLVAYTEALGAAALLGAECDPADLAGIHGCLGAMNWWLGRFGVASQQLQQAFDENTRIGNTVAAILNVAVLGLVREAQGRYSEALDCQRRGLRMARSAGVRLREASQLINVGYIHLRLEQFDDAADRYHQALTLFEQCEQTWAAAHAKFNLATAYEGLGHLDEALAYAQDALAVNRSLGHVIGRIRAMDAIGSICRRMGRPDEALDMLDEALRACRDANTPRPTMQVLNTLGETLCTTGEAARAIDSHAEALDLADLAGDRWQRTRALVGLGDAWLSLGRVEAAREYWREALVGQTDPRVPAVARIRDRLSRNPG